MLGSADANRALYICSGLSILILLTRLIATRIRYNKFDITSVLVVLSLVVLVVRLVTDYYYLKYGTAAAYIFLPEPPHLSAEKLSQVRTGTLLVLASRALITTFYWLQICLLLLFYSDLLRLAHWLWMIRATWVTIAITYIVCIIVTFTGCRPFRLYYQVDPNPGRCVLAYSQLLSQGICNIILDLMLLVIASPLVFVRQHTYTYLLRVWALYMIGCFCIITTILRIVYLYADTTKSYQAMRSFWASIQEITACFVANAPTIYGCFTLLKRRQSEQKFRRESRPEQYSSNVSSDPAEMNEPPALHDAGQLQLMPSNSAREPASDEEKVVSRHRPSAS